MATGTKGRRSQDLDVLSEFAYASLVEQPGPASGLRDPAGLIAQQVRATALHQEQDWRILPPGAVLDVPLPPPSPCRCSPMSDPGGVGCAAAGRGFPRVMQEVTMAEHLGGNGQRGSPGSARVRAATQRRHRRRRLPQREARRLVMKMARDGMRARPRLARLGRA